MSQEQEKIQDLAETVRRLRDENARLLSESARKDRVLAEQAVALSDSLATLSGIRSGLLDLGRSWGGSPGGSMDVMDCVEGLKRWLAEHT